jgi:Leucine-rich repeat (LRR) protein
LDRRILIDRILGRNSHFKESNPQESPSKINEEEEQQEEEQQQAQEISSDAEQEDKDLEENDNEPLEGPKGDASLWSNKQLKYKLRTLGYSTAGKRTTLLKRFRSVMHIQRQKELAAATAGQTLSSEANTPSTTSNKVLRTPTPTSTRKSKIRISFTKPTVERKTRKRKRDAANLDEKEIEKVSPSKSPNKKQKESDKAKSKKKRASLRLKTKPKKQARQEMSNESVTDLETNGAESYSNEPRSAHYTLSKEDLRLSSSFLRYFNEDLINRELLKEDDLEILESCMSESYTNRLLKDKSLLAHVDITDPDAVAVIDAVYSPRNNVGRNEAPQIRQRSEKYSKITNLQLQPHQMELDLVSSLSGIEHFSALRRLVCIGQRLTDISPISDCVVLEHIFLSHNFISKIPNLSKLEKLTALSLNFNQIKDISPLADCKSLKYLNISSNDHIEDISPLADCSNLVELDLSGNMLTDKQISQFATFSCADNLLTLRLNNNQIQNIFQVGATFKNLQELSLNNNRLYDLSPLIHLKKLNELDVQCNIAIYYSIEVYNAIQQKQLLLQQKKQKALFQRKGKSRPTARATPPTVTAAEEDVESLMTGSIYDTFVHDDGFEVNDTVYLWMQYGKVNIEVLECLAHLGTRCAVGKL